MKKISRTQAEAVLRRPRGKAKEPADAMLVVRGHLDQEGNWNIEWEGMHWLQGVPPDYISSSGMPRGLVGSASQELAAVAAGDVLESHAGKLAASIGESLGQGLLEVLRKRKEE